jgi:hypothetical protein
MGSALVRPDGLLETEVVFDIGAGLRPAQWFRAPRHVCIEAHGPYADKLREGGYEVAQMTALQFAYSADLTGAAVHLIDVIEHMEREDGEELLCILQASDARQIVIYTPYGFLPQEGDAWEMGGEYWQMHRSGWLPSDFPGWRIEHRGNPVSTGRAFFATFTREK